MTIGHLSIWQAIKMMFSCYVQIESRLPPLNGLVPALIGFSMIAWGWLNMNRERLLPWSGIAFLGGCVLWTYAGMVLLPWSAGGHYR